MLSSVLVMLLSADAGVVLAPCKERQIICFSPGGECDIPLYMAIDTAKTTLDVAIYSLNRQSVVDAILRAQKRGVRVRLLLDSSQATQAKERQLLYSMHDAGIEMRRDTHVGIMHWKLTVVDDNTFAIGSFNYTDPAVDSNDEYLMIWSCPRNALIFKAEFDKRWFAKTGFKDTTSWWPDAGL